MSLTTIKEVLRASVLQPFTARGSMDQTEQSKNGYRHLETTESDIFCSCCAEKLNSLSTIQSGNSINQTRTLRDMNNDCNVQHLINSVSDSFSFDDIEQNDIFGISKNNSFKNPGRSTDIKYKERHQRTSESEKFWSRQVKQYGSLAKTLIENTFDETKTGQTNDLKNGEHQQQRISSNNAIFVAGSVTQTCQDKTSALSDICDLKNSNYSNLAADNTLVKQADATIVKQACSKSGMSLVQDKITTVTTQEDHEQTSILLGTEELENSGPVSSNNLNLGTNPHGDLNEQNTCDETSGETNIQQSISSNQNTSYLNDGRISAIVIALFIMSWGVVLIVSKGYREDEDRDDVITPSPNQSGQTTPHVQAPNDIDSDTVDSVKLFLIFLNTFGIISYLYQSYHNGEANNEIDGDNGLKIIFLWIFSFVSIIYFIFEIISDSSCEKCLQKTNGVLNLIFVITLIVLFVTQLIYLQHYANHKFERSLRIHFMYVFMFSSVCGVWFHHLMSETTEHNVQQAHPSKCICLPDNSTFKHAMHHVLKPLLQPVVIESTLLALEILLVMWNSSVIVTRRNPRLEGTHHNATRTVEVVPRFKLFIRAITLVFNAPNVVFIVMFIIVKDMVLSNSVYEVCQVYAAIYKIIFVIGLVIAYYKVNTDCEQKSLTIVFKRHDFVFLVSAFFAMMLHGFELYAIIIHNQQGTLYWAIIVECVFDYIIDVFQTIFLIQIRGYKPKAGFGHGLPAVFCFLSISNGFLWSVYSFSLVMTVTVSQIPSQVYGKRNWLSLFHILLPLCCFYRFHAFYAFHQLTKHFKRR